MTRTDPVLVVDDVKIAYRAARFADAAAAVDVVHGVSFQVGRGETLSLVGQSGSGKSTIAHAVAGLLPPGGRVSGGAIRIAGTDVVALDRRAWRGLRGTTIGFVPQDPLSSLDPLRRVGEQIAQSLIIHRVVPRAEVAGAVTGLLERVGIRQPQERARAFPHELSGGQLQRVLIAIAIAAKPSLLVADEPTSALDVTTQRTILDLLEDLQQQLGLGVLLITHDLALAQERSDTLAVLNQGVLRECGPTAQVVERPSDPYTARLLSDAPALSLDKYASRRAQSVLPAETVVAVSGVTRDFGGARLALDEVSLGVAQGTIHAVVGESGSGKTTLARIIAGLEGFSSGSVEVAGESLPREPERVNRRARSLQLLHQNPLAAVDPRYTAERIIAEPLVIHGVGDRRARAAAVAEALDLVTLPAALARRKPRELSGGQRQRVAIARALVLAPRVLVLDEPTSALDVTVQAQIVEFLLDLRERLGLTYLFISHDLSLVRQIADRVTVLEQGLVVEDGAVLDVFADPHHEYTRRLIDAIPGGRRLATADVA